MEIGAYHGWRKAIKLTNGIIEVVAPTEVGPRIIRCGFVDASNEFKEYDYEPGDQWHIYGGHRLWHAPESKNRTYIQDNQPVTWQFEHGVLTLTQPIEPLTAIEKSLTIELAPTKAAAVVSHRLRNTGLWTIKLAAWALTVMAPGGRAILPHAPRGTHPECLTPTHSMTLWAYTDMADPRWHWGRKYIFLRQDSSAATPQKIGLRASAGWLAYQRKNHLFIKQFADVPDAHYPDLGCSVETFTNHEMLELETLGPMTELAPGATISHTEWWSLSKTDHDLLTDEDVDQVVIPLLHKHC